MINDIKAVVFDMDGVLIDSESLCDKIWYRLSKEMNLENIEDAIVENRGCNEQLMAEQLTRRYGNNFDCKKFFSDFSKYFHQEEFKNGIPLLPYVKETLDYLKQKNYKLALSTSTRRETATRQLKAVNIFDYFCVHTFGDEVEHSKPAPDIYLKAAKELGIEPKYCVGVEDSPNGIKSVFNAGFMPVMIPDRIEPNEEIKKLCVKIGKPISILKDIL